MPSTGHPEATTASNPPRALRTYGVLGLLALVPIAALSLYAYQLAASAIEQLIRSNNLSAALFTRELVQMDFQYGVNVVREHSRRPGLIAGVEIHDEEAVRAQLQVLVESHPDLIRAFVADPAGLLWSDFPKAPESLGKNFAYRDWYRGVTETQKPYISSVYRRNAKPRLLLVALAMPIHSADGQYLTGLLVAQMRLESITTLLKDIEVGSKGFVFLLDQSGTIAAHPHVDLQAREYREYAGVTPVVTLEDTDPAQAQYVSPILNVPMIATAVACDVLGQRWIIVAQQPLRDARRPVRLLALQIAAGGVLLAVIMCMLFVRLARYHNRVGDLNLALSEENLERRRAEQALQVANETLERRVQERTEQLVQKDAELLQAQKMEAIGRLAGGIAHDFNNLLTVITGYCDLALERIASDDPTHGNLQEVRRAGMRAAELTRQLLAFSRKQVLQPRMLDLNEVVGGLGKMLERLIGEDVRLVTSLSPGLHPVRVDPSQVEQIIMNLAINARDAMPSGGKLTIETGNVEIGEDYASKHPDATAGPHVVIAVTDTGTGMDAQTRERIFEPFFTTKTFGVGTGLGLSTVYGIVKQSGGNIWVYSEPGVGTTFKIYLPRAAADGAPSDPARTPATNSAKRPATILLVEDEDAVRDFVRTVLENDGYTVVDAADADAALAMANRGDRQFDLLLTDVILPKMGGRMLSEILTARQPSLKVAYMSGYTDNAVVHHGVLDAGMVYIEKPVAPDRLLQIVAGVLA